MSFDAAIGWNHADSRRELAVTWLPTPRRVYVIGPPSPIGGTPGQLLSKILTSLPPSTLSAKRPARWICWPD